MESYDIRLRKGEAGAALAYCTVKESDAAAIRTAHELADDGDTIEVWKGMRCIYAGCADLEPASPLLLRKFSRGGGRPFA